MSSVTVECLPYQIFIERYDRPYTLFYLDPPYWACERDCGPGLFERFIMSLNDVPEVREIFGRFRIESVGTNY